MTQTAIRLGNVTKKYTIHHEKPTLVERFINGKDEIFTALENVNLKIEKGERVGIVGPNGSGKTTLLKVIAGIVTQTKGNVYTEGRIVSLIDLGAGFHPDLTGYQNIFLNGLIIGMKKSDIKKFLNKIIEFADIKQFIDAPLYTYSAGMRLRLGFAVAVHSKPDILLLDEDLQVGDKFFQEKARQKIKTLFSRKTTLLIASHNTEVLRKYCKRIILLENGKVTRDGGLVILRNYEKAES